jgi:hypothetical protein
MDETWCSLNTELAILFWAKEDERMYALVNNTLQEGLAQGEDLRRLAGRLCSALGTAHEEAYRIAENVIGAVMSESRYESCRRAGMTHKKWICPRAPMRELGGHRDAERRYSRDPCPLNEPFLVNGVPLRFPRDYTSGHPEECIGCQCLAIVIYEPPA